MEEQTLKTSWKQRLIIAFVALLLLGSTIAVYVMIVLGNDTIDYSKMTSSQLETAYEEVYAEYSARAAELSAIYFDDFSTYRSKVKAYNSTTANSNGVTSKDLKEGDGDEVETGNYNAYYIGYCADESIFDSSFDSYDDPTELGAPLTVEDDRLIEGWYSGVKGMKIGGVREVTIPSSLAYGDSYEICGGYDSPIRFIIYAIERDEQLSEIYTRLNEIYAALSSAYASSYSDYSDYTTTSGE